MVEVLRIPGQKYMINRFACTPDGGVVLIFCRAMTTSSPDRLQALLKSRSSNGGTGPEEPPWDGNMVDNGETKRSPQAQANPLDQ